MNDHMIQQLEREIALYRQQEAEARIRRETLEGFLAKLKQQGTAFKESGPVALESAAAIEHPPNFRRSSKSSEIADTLVRLLGDGQAHRLADLAEAVQEQLGKKIPNSTIRFAVGNDSRIVKVGYGMYQLASAKEERPGEPAE